MSIPMLFRTRDKIELSFPLRVAAVAIGEPLTIEPNRLLFGDRSIATASDYALPISYYGPRRTIRTVSAASLIDGQVDREAIQDRIVVLGVTATGVGDFFPTPFDSRDARRGNHFDGRSRIWSPATASCATGRFVSSRPSR